MSIIDSGRGISEELDLKNIESLGLKLVSLLVDQIDGCIGLKRDRGTKFTILFGEIGK